MLKTMKFVGIVICVLAVCATLAFIVQKCSKPNVITEEVVVVDSVAVQTLEAEIAELTNKLKAKPKYITITNTVPGEPVTITDTLLVYPVGSYAARRDYPFSFAAEKDSVSMNVNTDLYVYVYADERGEQMFHEDSLRVWITDFTLKKYIVAPPAPKRNIFYLSAGVNARQYDQIVAGQTIVQTELYPSVGLGYMWGWLGAYATANMKGGGLGVTIAPAEIFRKY